MEEDEEQGFRSSIIMFSRAYARKTQGRRGGGDFAKTRGASALLSQFCVYNTLHSTHARECCCTKRSARRVHGMPKPSKGDDDDDDDDGDDSSHSPSLPHENEKELTQPRFPTTTRLCVVSSILLPKTNTEHATATPPRGGRLYYTTPLTSVSSISSQLSRTAAVGSFDLVDMVVVLLLLQVCCWRCGFAGSNVDSSQR